VTEPECRPEDVAVSVEWELRDDGALAGRVVVENTGPRACRLTGKPRLRPLGADGRPLATQTVVTLEARRPDFVVVPPGGRARSAVTWAGWAGPPATGRLEVGWGDRRSTAVVRGPVQPARTAEPHNLTSSWFELDG
jgi:hypothetical protein